MTRSTGGIDHRLFEPLRNWDAPVLVATGKSLPYPVALCTFIGLPRSVVAENGGVVLVGDELVVEGDGTAAGRVAEQLRADGHPAGWPAPDLHNRWRQTELSVDRSVPVEYLRSVADAHGLTVVDTGYAYHVKAADVTKGVGLERASERLGLEPGAFVAIGDSANDVALFEAVGTAYAVANAADVARERADIVTEASYGAGVLEALERIRRRR